MAPLKRLLLCHAVHVGHADHPDGGKQKHVGRHVRHGTASLLVVLVSRPRDP